MIRGDDPHGVPFPSWSDDAKGFSTGPAEDEAVENLLLRELSAAQFVTPLARERLVEWMRDCDYTYFISSDDQVGGIFLGRLFSFGLLGPDRSILCIRGTWNRDVAIERVEEMLEYCNEWNSTQLWPKVYLRVPDNGAVQVHTEVVTDLEYGATADQLDQILECGLRTGLLFFDSLDAHYPDPVKQAP